MSLTKEDLQAISGIMDEKIEASENRMMTYFENTIQKDIKQIAEGHLMLAGKMDRMETKFDVMQTDIDEIKATVTAHEIIITNKYKMA